MVTRIQWILRKVKVFMYLLPGAVLLLITAWLVFFANGKYQYPYQHPTNDFQKIIAEKTISLDYPKIENYEIKDGKIILSMQSEKNYYLFIDVMFRKTIGSYQLISSDVIHRCGFYKEVTSKELIISGQEIKQQLNSNRPDSIIDFTLIDIVIIEVDENETSLPIRISSNGSGLLQIEEIQAADFSINIINEKGVMK